MAKEALARIKINRLLEESGWRFFEDTSGPANIRLELHVKIEQHDLDALGDDFERAKNGFIDYLLLDDGGFPDHSGARIRMGREGELYEDVSTGVMSSKINCLPLRTPDTRT